MKRTPFNLRPVPGLRKGPMSSASTTASSEKPTLSGSTAQHGPRFKRYYRSQTQGLEEVCEEVTMEEECDDMEKIGNGVHG